MKKIKPYENIPPGDFIKEELEFRGWTQEDLADVLGITLKSVNKIINSKQNITLNTAQMLGQAFGQSPQYWVNLDTNYRLRDLKDSQKNSDVELKSIIYKYMPIKEMIKMDWIQPYDTVNSLVEQVVKYWDIQNLNFDFIEKEAASLHFRKSEAYHNFNSYYAITWFQKARTIAYKKNNPQYDRDALLKICDNFHQYTITENGLSCFLSDLVNAGIKFFVLNHLPKTYIDAASFRNNKTPVIVYTGRHNRIDNFWFSMAHEIAHVLNDLKGKNEYYLDDMDREPSNEREKRANEFATKLLRHEYILDYFRYMKKYISEYRVQNCAQKLGIHPGIIVGILQHEGYLSHSNLNKLKLNVREIIPENYFVCN